MNELRLTGIISRTAPAENIRLIPATNSQCSPAPSAKTFSCVQNVARVVMIHPNRLFGLRLKNAVLRAVLPHINLEQGFDLPAHVLLADIDEGNNSLLLDEIAWLAQKINPKLTRDHLTFFADPSLDFSIFRAALWKTLADLAPCEPSEFGEVPEELYSTTNLASHYRASIMTDEVLLAHQAPDGTRVVGVPNIGPEFCGPGGFQSQRVVYFEDGKIKFAVSKKPVPIHAWLGYSANTGMQIASDITGAPIQSTLPFHTEAGSKNWFYSRLGELLPFPETYLFSDEYDVKTFDFNAIRGKKIILKPDNGYGGYGVIIVNFASPKKVKAYLESHFKLTANTPILLQEYVKTPEKYTWKDENGQTIGWIAGVFVVQADIQKDPIVPEIAYYCGPIDKPINPYQGAERISEAELFDRLNLDEKERKKMKEEMAEIGQTAMMLIKSDFHQQTIEADTYDEKDLPRLLRLDMAYDGERFVVLEVNSGKPGCITPNGGAVKAWVNMMAEEAAAFRAIDGAQKRDFKLTNREREMLYKNDDLREMMEAIFIGGLDFVFESIDQDNILPFYVMLTILFSQSGYIDLAEATARLVLESAENNNRDFIEKNIYQAFLISPYVPDGIKQKYLGLLIEKAEDMNDFMALAEYFFRVGEFEKALSYYKKVSFFAPELAQRAEELAIKAAIAAGDKSYLKGKKLNTAEKARVAILEGNIEKAKELYREAAMENGKLNSFDVLVFGLLLAEESPDDSKNLLQAYIGMLVNCNVHQYAAGRFIAG